MKALKLLAIPVLFFALFCTSFAQVGGTTVGTVFSTGTGTNISFTNPYDNTTMNVFAGVFIGSVDGSPAEFYCVDIRNNLAINPEVYTDSGYVQNRIIHVLKNSYPVKGYPYPGALGNQGEEVAAIQAAIWKIADNIDLNTINNANVKNRAIQIYNDANTNGTATPPITTMSILPLSVNNPPNVADTIQVKVLDDLGFPMNDVGVDLTTTSGTLNHTHVKTGPDGLTPKIIITKGSDSVAVVKACASGIYIPYGMKYIHTLNPNTKQKIVLASDKTQGNLCYAVTVTWTTPSSGNGGGVESNYDMAEALLIRHIRMINGETSKLVANENFLFSPSFTLQQIVPLSGPMNTIGSETTPFDILGISNATSAYAVDYKNSFNQRVGVIFSTTTNAPQVYTHSKFVCDRLALSNLNNISAVYAAGHPYYIGELFNTKKGYTDYSIMLSVYEMGDRFIVDNKWTLDEYNVPDGALNVYNFQVWGSNPEMTKALVESLIGKLTSFKTVAYTDGIVKDAKIFVKNARYSNDGKIKMTIVNNTNAEKTVPLSIKYTPQQGASQITTTRTVTVPAGVSEQTFSIGIFSSASITTTAENGFKDAVFVGGGAYAPFIGPLSTLTQFTLIHADNNGTYNPNSLIFPGGAQLNGVLGDKMYIARSIDASYEGINLSTFDKLKFTAFNNIGSAVMSVYLEAKQNGQTVYPFVNVPVVSGNSIEIPLNQFKINNQPVDLSSVTMITFQLDKFYNQSLSTVEFGVKNVVVVANTVGITQNGSDVPSQFALSQNYPNPFNPTTNIAYQLPVSGQVSLKVYDMLGKEVASLVNQKMNAGSYTADFNAAVLSSGMYIYRLEVKGDNGASFSQTKKMVLVK